MKTLIETPLSRLPSIIWADLLRLAKSTNSGPEISLHSGTGEVTEKQPVLSIPTRAMIGQPVYRALMRQVDQYGRHEQKYKYILIITAPECIQIFMAWYPFINVGSGPIIVSPDNTIKPNNSSHLNVPMLGLGLALIIFLLACTSICFCSYHQTKAHTQQSHRDVQGNYVDLDIELQYLSPVTLQEEGQGIEDQAPPAYTYCQTSRPASEFLRSLTPSPALAASSPALSQYEDANLLPASTKALTPLQPAYVR
jgi:hypothetical protein